jgi:hypothetical protein
MLGPGPVVAGGMLYVNSGYGAFGGRPGNVLLAFGIPKASAEQTSNVRTLHGRKSLRKR